MKNSLSAFALVMLPLFMLVTGSMAAELPGLPQLLERYKKAVISQDADELVAITYPAFFRLASKKIITQKLKGMYVDEKVPTIQSIVFTQIGAQQAFGKGVFAIIDTSVDMALPRPGDATPQIDGLMIDIMKSQLGEQTRVEIDEKNSLVLIKRDSQLIAIKEQQGDWRLIDADQFGMIAGKKFLAKDLEQALLIGVKGADTLKKAQKKD